MTCVIIGHEIIPLVLVTIFNFMVYLNLGSQILTTQAYHSRSSEIEAAPARMSDFHPDSIRNDTDSKTLGRQVMAHTRDADLVIFFHALEVCV